MNVSAPTELQQSLDQPISLPRPTLHKPSVWRERLELILLIVLVFTVVNLASMRFYIEGPSMQSTFYAGQFLIVSRAHYLLSDPQRGDIVVFDAPGDDNRSNNPLLIKRLIGLPGDHIVVQEGQVFVNDVPLDEPYVHYDPGESLFRCGGEHCDVVLDENQYYMMGDNRNESNDSRAFGPVDRIRLVGEAIIRYWPPADWGIVTRIGYPD
jgi:signal peptidase I